MLAPHVFIGVDVSGCGRGIILFFGAFLTGDLAEVTDMIDVGAEMSAVMQAIRAAQRMIVRTRLDLARPAIRKCALVR